MNKAIAIIYFCTLSILSTSAYAERTVLTPDTIPAFDDIDVNRDSSISRDEANNSKSTWLMKSFDMIDKNKDGELSKSEYKKVKSKSS